MLEQGWQAEVEGLVLKGLAEPVRKANIIGYSELLSYIEGQISRDEAVSSIKQNTRRYAKRQVTWFARQSGCRYYSDSQEVIKALGGS
jgi:tRNA dimethylallyltransferase